MTNTIIPAVEQTTLYIYQPLEYHNPGGSPNTVWTEILSEHQDLVQSIFASELIDIDAVRVRTEWRGFARTEPENRGYYFVVYIEYTYRDLGDTYLQPYIDSAISKLPEGMQYKRMEVGDTLNSGIWRQCVECRGVGHHTKTTNGGRAVEIDCKNCDGTGRALTTELTQWPNGILTA